MRIYSRSLLDATRSLRSARSGQSPIPPIFEYRSRPNWTEIPSHENRMGILRLVGRSCSNSLYALANGAGFGGSDLYLLSVIRYLGMSRPSAPLAAGLAHLPKEFIADSPALRSWPENCSGLFRDCDYPSGPQHLYTMPAL